MKVLLANPRVLRRGGSRDRNRESSSGRVRSPIYVRHEVVHNRFVVENLRTRGAIFCGRS